uniref:hypothetical protein n=1 Tax=Nonomuraea sp. CA-252377 TaxID=3240003 RepID=UPI003F497057
MQDAVSDAGGQVGLLEGHLVRTLASRLLPQDLASMTMRGARPAGPEPATAALPRASAGPFSPPGNLSKSNARSTAATVM